MQQTEKKFRQELGTHPHIVTFYVWAGFRPEETPLGVVSVECHTSPNTGTRQMQCEPNENNFVRGFTGGTDCTTMLFGDWFCALSELHIQG